MVRWEVVCLLLLLDVLLVLFDDVSLLDLFNSFVLGVFDVVVVLLLFRKFCLESSWSSRSMSCSGCIVVTFCKNICELSIIFWYKNYWGRGVWLCGGLWWKVMFEGCNLVWFLVRVRRVLKLLNCRRVAMFLGSFVV